MKKLGIRYQILLITLIPVLLTGSFFTYKHINNSIAHQSEILHSSGRTIARQIANRVKPHLVNGNQKQIQALLNRTIEVEDILQVSVYGKDGGRIAEAAATTFDSSKRNDYHYSRQAILFRDIDQAHESGGPGWVNLSISRLPLQQKLTRVIVESIVFFIVALIVTVILTSFISRRITHPIFRLIEQLRQVEQGQLGKAIEPTESNEIGALQNGFNRMTGALLANRRHLNRRIQQATKQLNEAITDLEAKNRELGFARDLAEDANQTKSEFLANMSHEIRTPINGIKGFIGLLSQSDLDPGQKHYVDIITKSTSDLTGIVDEILDFSKMESGKLNIVDETFDLYEVIEQTRDILFINALAKDIDLNLILFSDTPQWVVGDKLRLKQILLNLLGNAIKFTDQGKVVIRVSLDDLDDERASILMSVEDSGIGISELDQQSLFQAFGQVGSSDTRHFTGTGLGLVISKNLAGLMGGSINLHSTLGEGSRFDLKLPFKLSTEQGKNPENDLAAAGVLILAARQTNLMEIRTLFDRAGAITEGELVDTTEGIEPLLHAIQRNIAFIDLLVFDLRHFDIDLAQLLSRASFGTTRIIAMHYDPAFQLPAVTGEVEFVSIINTSRSIAQIIDCGTAIDEVQKDVVESTSIHSKKVLLVDDNQVNLKLASELIRLWGHEVHEAEHGDGALEMYRRDRFDLVILDIQMPDIDGVSLLHMMREIDPGDKTPMVALTANVLNNEADRLLELGFDYFLGKPIDEIKFRALLDGNPQAQTDTVLKQENADSSLDYVRSLDLAAGNESLLLQILQILHRDLPEQRQHLADAFDDFDLDRLGALAHKLHGVTCYASLPRLRRIVITFEQQLAGASRDSLAAMVEELDAELVAVEYEVDRFLQKVRPDALSE